MLHEITDGQSRVVINKLLVQPDLISNRKYLSTAICEWPWLPTINHKHCMCNTLKTWLIPLELTQGPSCVIDPNNIQSCLRCFPSLRNSLIPSPPADYSPASFFEGYVNRQCLFIPYQRTISIDSGFAVWDF